MHCSVCKNMYFANGLLIYHRVILSQCDEIGGGCVSSNLYVGVSSNPACKR